MVWCSVEKAHNSILIGCIYRSPYSNRVINRNIILAINRASLLCDQKQYRTLIIAGDFNHPDLFWYDLSCSYNPNGFPSSIDMADCLNDNLLSQVVDQPTYSTSILDLVITNDPTHRNQLHCSLLWNFSLNTKPKSTQNQLKLFNKGDYVLFSELISINSTLFTNQIVDEAYEKLIEIYNDSLNQCVPLSNIIKKISPSPKLMNKEIKLATKEKYKLYCKVRASRSNLELKNSCKISSKLVKSLLNQPSSVTKHQ